MAEFFHTHPNILMAQFFHTSGGFTYRPLGSAPQTQIAPKDRAVFDFIMGKKYLEIIGEEVPAAWMKPDSIPALREELRQDVEEQVRHRARLRVPARLEGQLRRAGRPLRTATASPPTGTTCSSASTRSRPSCGTPRSTSPGSRRSRPGEDAGAARQRALLQFNDKQYGGKAFVAWKPFKHPELGEGEIGGWHPKYASNAWPGDILKGVCDRHVQFELFRAGLMPELAITEAFGARRLRRPERDPGGGRRRRVTP